jgi:hypothetical protein
MNSDIERSKVEDVKAENRETTSVYGSGGRRDPGGRPGNNNAGESDTKSTPNAANTEETDVPANADRTEPAAQSMQGSSKADNALRLPSRTELRTLWLKEYGEQDYALQMWTRVVEQQDLEIEMMLQMHGMLIFGLMVSTQRYAQFYIDLNEELHRENEPDTADALRDYYTALIPPQDQEIGPEGLPVIFRYVHMRDVTIMNGGHKIKLPYWRGKLGAVDAFVVGATAEE